MRRRIVITLLLVVLVSLSGCSLIFGGGDGGSGTDSPTVTPTAGNGTTTTPSGPSATPTYPPADTPEPVETPTLTPTPTPDRYYISDIDELNAEELVRDHRASLRRAESFRMEQNYYLLSNVTREVGGAWVNKTVRGNRTQDQYYRVQTTEGQVIRVFTSGDTTYKQVNYTQGAAENETRVYREPYSNNELSEFTPAQLNGAGVVSSVSAVQTFENVNFESLENVVGENGTRYSIIEADGPAALDDSITGNRDIDDFTVRMVVGQEGRIYYFKYRIAETKGGEQFVTETKVVYRGFNSTTVSRPSWTFDS